MLTDASTYKFLMYNCAHLIITLKMELYILKFIFLLSCILLSYVGIGCFVSPHILILVDFSFCVRETFIVWPLYLFQGACTS